MNDKHDISEFAKTIIADGEAKMHGLSLAPGETDSELKQRMRAMTFQPTTAECIAKIDVVLQHYHCDDTWFGLYTSIRAQLLAAQEMAKALECAKKTIDLIVKYPNLSNNLSRSQQREDQAEIEKALTAYRKAGGQ